MSPVAAHRRTVRGDTPRARASSRMDTRVVTSLPESKGGAGKEDTEKPDPALPYSRDAPYGPD